MDILSANDSTNKLVWFENDGNQNFTEKVVGNSLLAHSIVATDIDGDGDVDVLLGDVFKVVWFENDGSQNFTERTINSVDVLNRSVFASDVDRDGDVDVVVAVDDSNKISWYENNGSQVFTERALTTSSDSVRSVFATDMDSDGDIDILYAALGSGEFGWFENDGAQNFTENVIVTLGSAARAWTIFARDLDGDGDMDAVASARDDGKVRWFENDGSQNFTEHVIASHGLNSGAIAAFPADVDGDGDTDVVTGVKTMTRSSGTRTTATRALQSGRLPLRPMSSTASL